MIALYKGRSWFSRIIRWFTWSQYSHAAWICRDGTILEAVAGRGVIRSSSLSDAHTPLTEVDVFKLNITEEQAQAVEAFMTRQLGKRYDWLGILGLVLRRRTENQGAWFCSELVTNALNAAGIYPLLRVPCCKIFPGLLALSPLLSLRDSFQTRTMDAFQFARSLGGEA